MGWNLLKTETEKPKMEDYWHKPEDIVQKSGLKALIYGEPEVGKTHFALTFPDPIYVVDTEFGLAPLLQKDLFKDKEIRVFEACVLDTKTVEVDPIKSIEALERALSALSTLQRGTVVIDSISDVWQWLQAWLEVVASKKTSTGQPYRFEYGKANMRYRKLILRLIAQPINVVLTAKVTEKYDSSGNPMGVYVPRAQKDTSHMVDVVLYAKKEFDPIAKRWKYASTLTKCRFQRGFEAELEDVTYDKLIALLKEQLGVVIV